MPAWNARSTILSAVHSVLDQSHQHLELIVVDDGSEDDTVALLETIDDTRLCVEKSRHQGVSATRNLGIKLSNGSYIAFIDADDLWLERKLELQLEALNADPNAAVAYGLLDRIDENGNQRSPHTRAIHNGNVYETLLVWNIIGNGSNLLVRTQAINAVGDFNESLQPAEDWEFSVRLARKYTYVCVPEVLGLYRQSKQSASNRLQEMERGYRKAMNIIHSNPTRSERLFRRQGLAVHYHYLLCKALQGNYSVRTAISCIRYFLYLLVYSSRSQGIHRSLGINQPFLRTSIRLMRPRKEPSKWSIGDEFKYTGMIKDARPLNDPSILPELIADEKVFREAIQELQVSGNHYRVPYLITPAIRRVAFDPSIVAMVHQILGDRTAWVMWGANIRSDVPNQAYHWHTDTESSNWDTITVVVGLSGCNHGNASNYIPCSHWMDNMPPDDLSHSQREEALTAARLTNPTCQTIETFSHFTDGSFYAFNAKGWHCGDPVSSKGRLLLFMHYQRAKDKRVPYMDNYVENTWFDRAAAYVSCFEGEGRNNYLPTSVNQQVHRPPSQSISLQNRLFNCARKLWRMTATKSN